jgi:hypothetical protein
VAHVQQHPWPEAAADFITGVRDLAP